jgi:hypothetical protein
MIAIVLALVLVIGLVVMFYVNQTSIFHQSGGAQRTAARSVSEDGVAYAIQELSASNATWTSALGKNFTAAPDCNGGLVSGTAGQFTLACGNDPTVYPNLQPYEVGVIVAAPTPSGSAPGTNLRAIQVNLGQRTLGLDPPIGPHLAAALELVRPPILSGTLDVEWGPIICLDASSTWTLTDPMDTQRYPRKMSMGVISGGPLSTYPRMGVNATGPDTDQKEYWGKVQGSSFLPLVDEEGYVSAAQKQSGITAPISSITGNPLTPINCVGSPPLSCGHFQTDPKQYEVAIFDGGYTPGIPNAMIYVDGPAQFGNVNIDGAHVIVTRQLELAKSGGGGNVLSLHVPWSAPSEYPYSASWDCKGSGSCKSNSFPGGGPIQFRGFLYVKGNLVVATGATWNIAGTVLVGDMGVAPTTSWQLNVQNGATLNIFYDDIINHQILMATTPNGPIKVVPDFIHDIPAP